MQLTIKIDGKDIELTRRVAEIHTQGWNDAQDGIRALLRTDLLAINDSKQVWKIARELIDKCAERYGYSDEEQRIYAAGVNTKTDWTLNPY
ncbi:hypothetical protein HYV80_07545 [Candidatus Woesearchaeota archaeon]|nr:hypothetical protein [Candidatus Woesearchaeota archaeon]